MASDSKKNVYEQRKKGIEPWHDEQNNTHESTIWAHTKLKRDIERETGGKRRENRIEEKNVKRRGRWKCWKCSGIRSKSDDGNAYLPSSSSLLLEMLWCCSRCHPSAMNSEKQHRRFANKIGSSWLCCNSPHRETLHWLSILWSQSTLYANEKAAKTKGERRKKIEFVEARKSFCCHHLPFAVCMDQSLLHSFTPKESSNTWNE